MQPNEKGKGGMKKKEERMVEKDDLLFFISAENTQ